MAKKIKLSAREILYLLNALSVAIDDAEFDHEEDKIVAYHSLYLKVRK